MIKFSKANAKLKAMVSNTEIAKWLKNKRKVYSFDLLSGWSCPGAKDCLSKVIINTEGKRRIKDGVHTLFRCFSTSQEVQYPATYDLRKANFDALKKLSVSEIVSLIQPTIPKDAGVIRMHVGGDFFNNKYMQAWVAIAKANPDILFYAYTKSLPYWMALRAEIDALPNLVLTASRGGKHDHLIDEHGLREAIVVFSPEQAEKLGLEIDHDDTSAARPSVKDQNFALLIHGTQPKGSEASEAIKRLKKDKVKFSYS
jgi:hypothetical protein